MAKSKSKYGSSKNRSSAYSGNKRSNRLKDDLPVAQPKVGLLDKISAMPIASKITILSGSLVMILGIYGLFQPKTPTWIYVSTQLFLAVMFCSMGYKEMQQNPGRKNYILFYTGAALCVGVALKYLGLF